MGELQREMWDGSRRVVVDFEVEVDFNNAQLAIGISTTQGSRIHAA